MSVEQHVISCKFAIGIPVYNESRYIEQTLSAIINTVGDSVPIIVSDNSSTDNTLGIVKRFAESHGSVKAIVNSDGRVASNFLNCLTHIDSEYFCWISGHDLICGDFWGDAIRYLDEHPTAVWVYGSCAMIDADGDPYVTTVKADSDVDSIGLTDVEIMRKLLKVGSGMFVHGVFRRSAFFDCRFAGGWAGDRCLIAYACFRGEVHWIRAVSIIRRIQRSVDGGETLEARNERYREWGLLEYEEAGIEPKYYMRLKLFRIFVDERSGNVSINNFVSVFRVLFGPVFASSTFKVLSDLRKVRTVESGFPRKRTT